MGAMAEEIAPMLDRVEGVVECNLAGNVYYECKYKGLSLVIAYSKIGKVNAALSASILLNHFSCEALIFSGVAGAISPELKIRDLLLATKLCQHDVDITAFSHPFGFIPGGQLFYESDDKLNQIARHVAKKQGIVLKEGIIATGDQFVASTERKQWIGEEFGAIALEMEGGSVAAVAAALNRPFCVLRAISDAADTDASFNFDTFLHESAKESADFLFLMLDTLV